VRAPQPRLHRCEPTRNREVRSGWECEPPPSSQQPLCATWQGEGQANLCFSLTSFVDSFGSSTASSARAEPSASGRMGPEDGGATRPAVQEAWTGSLQQRAAVVKRIGENHAVPMLYSASATKCDRQMRHLQLRDRHARTNKKFGNVGPRDGS
jgi:squalene cyclase